MHAYYICRYRYLIIHIVPYSRHNIPIVIVGQCKANLKTTFFPSWLGKKPQKYKNSLQILLYHEWKQQEHNKAIS